MKKRLLSAIVVFSLMVTFVLGNGIYKSLSASADVDSGTAQTVDAYSQIQFESIFTGARAVDNTKGAFSDSEGSFDPNNVYLKMENGSDNSSGSAVNIVDVGGTYNSAWLEYKNINFSANGSKQVSVRYVNNSTRCKTDAKLELHIDSKDGALIGTVNLPSTGSNWNAYATATATLDKYVSGIHDLYVVLLGSNPADNGSLKYVANLDWFQFTQSSSPQVNPYNKVEFEYAYKDAVPSGSTTGTPDTNKGDSYSPGNTLKWEGSNPVDIGGTAPGSWLSYKNLKFFGNGANQITVRYCNNTQANKCRDDAYIEVRLDSVTGPLAGKILLPGNSDGWGTYGTNSANLDASITGTHDVFLLLKSDAGTEPYVANLDWFQFNQAAATRTLIAKGSTWSYLLNGSAKLASASPNWLDPAFVKDSRWQSAKTTIGFSSKAASATGLDTGTAITPETKSATDATKNNADLYLRKLINIDDVNELQSVTAQLNYDDGFILYVNGTEAARQNVPGDSGYAVVDIIKDSGNVTINKSLFKTGTNVISVKLVNDRADSSDLLFNMQLTASAVYLTDPETKLPTPVVEPEDPTMPYAVPETVLLAKGATWKYLENGTGTDWLGASFDDSSWKSGAAPLGYCNSDAFPVSTSIAKSEMTAYFRNTFTVSDAGGLKSLKATFTIDDGAIFYINGVEAGRYNMSGSNTPLATIDKPTENSAYLDTANIKTGTNVIEVAVYNASATSSDLCLDLSLTENPATPYVVSKLALTPGSTASELNLAWYTPAPYNANKKLVYPFTADETAYIYADDRSQQDGAIRFTDRDHTVTYKIPLKADATKAYLVVSVAQNYAVSISTDNVTYSDLRVDPSLTGKEQCDKSNKTDLIFDLKDELSAGATAIYFKMGDQTTAEGWGGCLYSFMLTYDDYPPVNNNAQVQIAKKADMTGTAFPADKATAFTGTVSDAIANYSTNKVTATGLEPNTAYVYRIGDGTDANWSQVYNYTTKGTDDFDFIYVGDAQIGASGNTATDTTNWCNTVTKALQTAPEATFMLSAGDQVDAGANEDEYAGFFAPQELTSLPIATAIGNHDANDPNHIYHFNDPNATTLGRTGAGTNYYFSYGSTLFIVLNGNSANIADHTATVKAATEAYPDAKWKIVMMHHDIYGSAKHSIEQDVLNLKAGLFPVFDQYGIDVVLDGHDHTYTRSYIMKGDQPQKDQIMSSTGAAIAPDGTLYITANSSSGSKYYDLLATQAPYVATRSQIGVPTFATVSIDNNKFEIKTYRTDTMEVTDSYAIQKSATKADVDAAITAASGKTEATYTPASWASFKTALEAAQGVQAEASPTDEELTTAYADLYAAQNGLVEKADTSALAALIQTATNKYNAAVEGTQPGQYPASARAAFKTAIDSANGVLANTDASADDIQAAINGLNTAISTFDGAVVSEPTTTTSGTTSTSGTAPSESTSSSTSATSASTTTSTSAVATTTTKAQATTTANNTTANTTAKTTAQSAGYTIKGQLLSNGKPVANTVVELHSDVQRVTTDANGWFTFSNVEAGSHTLQVLNSDNTVAASLTFEIKAANVSKPTMSDGVLSVPASVTALSLNVNMDNGVLTISDVTTITSPTTGDSIPFVAVGISALMAIALGAMVVSRKRVK